MGAGWTQTSATTGERPHMARLVGVDLPREKRMEIALTYIFGVGRTRASQTLAATGISPDKRAKDLTGTIPPVVRIELGIPGRSDLVVSHEPDHLLRKYQHPDLHKAINEAFRIAERQLLDLKEQRDDRAQGAAHDSESQSLGQIAEITPEQDFGFLLTKEGGLLYFHRNAVLSGDFDDLKRGDEVYYIEDLGDTGPIAVKVRVKARSIASPR